VRLLLVARGINCGRGGFALREPASAQEVWLEMHRYFDFELRAGCATRRDNGRRETL